MQHPDPCGIFNNGKLKKYVIIYSRSIYGRIDNCGYSKLLLCNKCNKFLYILMVEQIKDFTAGAVGGLLVVLSGHPLDTIKVRLQTMPTPAPGQLPMFTGVFHCFKKTVKHEGFYGLYKGMSSRIVAITPHAALSFLGFSIGKEVVSHIKNDPSSKLSLPELFWAGSIAGLFTVFIVTPSERIACLLQIQKGTKEKE